jgi:predicted O-methyltransferase YrrM
MSGLLRRVLHSGSDAYNHAFNRRFAELQRNTRGMLNPLVYRRLYRLAFAGPDLPIVEVGGATGSGSIALAWGLKEAGKRSKVIVIEKMEGGSRTQVGDYQQNLDLVLGNFRRFGVEEQVELFPHELTMENGHEVVRLAGGPIAAFMSDADGRIHRDFQLFWPLLVTGGSIVIDDYSASADYKPVSAAHPQGGAKCMFAYRLLNQMMAWGLFRKEWRLQQTVFGVKPQGADISRLDPAVCEEIIAQVERERALKMG